MLHPHDSMGIRFECVRRPSLFLPTPGCAFNRSAFAHFRPVNRLCLRVYVPAERALFVHRVSSKSRRISRKQIESSTAVSISIFSNTRLIIRPLFIIKNLHVEYNLSSSKRFQSFARAISSRFPRLGAVSLLSQKSIGPASLGSLHRHLTFAYLEVGILSPPMHCAPAPGRIGGQAGPPQAYRHIHRHRQRGTTIIMAVVPPP